MEIWKYAIMKIWKYRNMQIWKYTNIHEKKYKYKKCKRVCEENRYKKP